MSKQPNQTSAPTDEAPEAGKQQEQYGTFRLDALGVSGNGAMIEGPPKRRVPFQAVVLVALVVLAAGALYAMRRLGMGPMGAIAEVKIDYDYEKKGAKADHRKLLADLSTSQIEHQVPVDKVQKNPFRMPDLRPEFVETTEVVAKPTKDPNEEAKKKRAEAIAAAVKTLKVHTVLSGTVPVARIGDENVRVGDTVAEYFTVQSIAGRSVDLIADGQVYTLSLDDEVQNGPRRKTNSKK